MSAAPSGSSNVVERIQQLGGNLTVELVHVGGGAKLKLSQKRPQDMHEASLTLDAIQLEALIDWLKDQGLVS